MKLRQRRLTFSPASLDFIVINIHRMQIWRTTRSSPGTSHESEASEASVFCFDNASPEKSCFVDGLVCFISLCLRVFVFLNASSRLRENSGSMEFAETKEVSRRSPWELKFVRYPLWLEDLTKSFQ